MKFYKFTSRTKKVDSHIFAATNLSFPLEFDLLGVILTLARSVKTTKWLAVSVGRGRGRCHMSNTDLIELDRSQVG